MDREFARKSLFVFACFILINTIVIIFAADTRAGSREQLTGILQTFSGTYSQNTGIRFADQILHPNINAMDGGATKKYRAMHEMIAKRWGRRTIKYDYKAINISENIGIGNVIEHAENEWDSAFVFVAGGAYGGRLIHYHSVKISD